MCSAHFFIDLGDILNVTIDSLFLDFLTGIYYNSDKIRKILFDIYRSDEGAEDDFYKAAQSYWKVIMDNNVSQMIMYHIAFHIKCA